MARRTRPPTPRCASGTRRPRSRSSSRPRKKGRRSPRWPTLPTRGATTSRWPGGASAMGGVAWRLSTTTPLWGRTHRTARTSTLGTRDTLRPLIAATTGHCGSTWKSAMTTAVSGYFADVVDPGSDDLALDWSWGDGTPGESGTHFNDGTAPDPSASPNGTYPFAVMEARTHAFGDDGGYPITVTAADDDTGAVAYMSIVTIRNVAPTLDLFALPDSDEGSVLPFTAGFSDPGFDVPSAGTMEDFTAAVDWGDGIVEALAVLEFPGGPGVATTGALQGSHVYADDGTYAATLTVCDDDGGCGSATDTVHVRNVVPAVDAGPDLSIDEAGTAAITATFFDPGFDFAPAGTLEDFTATVSWELRSTQATAGTEGPGSAGILTTGSLTPPEAYRDNRVYVVTLTVSDH